MHFLISLACLWVCAYSVQLLNCPTNLSHSHTLNAPPINPLNPSCACVHIPCVPETFWAKLCQNWWLGKLHVYLWKETILSIVSAFHLKVDRFSNSPVSPPLRSCTDCSGCRCTLFTLSRCVTLESESPTDERFQTNLATVMKIEQIYQMKSVDGSNLEVVKWWHFGMGIYWHWLSMQRGRSRLKQSDWRILFFAKEWGKPGILYHALDVKGRHDNHQYCDTFAQLKSVSVIDPLTINNYEKGLFCNPYVLYVL